ncbi:hypothetical protein DL897_00785 [Thermoflavimicrobium daqui]|uniref:YetF C-terminal domain-containing protein n=2 Tax=Thermoflavimicrobium daqui TaxID=2137476 RepID=A0A364K9X9_9BACL|nr:hypothetical protein DL897_00785 [Thermoflavimicrobium daqui]
MYFFLLLMLRLMGKREIGKLSVFDLIVSFMIADLSATVIEDIKLPVFSSVIPIASLVGLQILVSFIMLKSRKVRGILDGEPTIIIKNGKLQREAMSKVRYNMDDLLMQLRDKNIANVADVEFAILETSGKLSVFPKEEKKPVTKSDITLNHHLKPFTLPIPVIIDGEIQDKELSSLGFNRFWLKKELKKKGYNQFKDVFYACADENGSLYVEGNKRSKR